MPHDARHPDFYRLFYDEAKPIVETLPQGQAQNLLGAMAIYFLFRLEPHGLPRAARAMFEVHRIRLDNYRRSVLNGMKNNPNSAQNPNEIETKFGGKSDTKTTTDFESL